MLVLSRLKDERLVLDLGDGRLVWLTVCDVRRRPRLQGSQVRLGIEAPQEVKVWREEIWNGMAAG
jgi:carbon storage regulator CsrA